MIEKSNFRWNYQQKMQFLLPKGHSTMKKLNGRISFNLVKSRELISHFIRLHLVPLPPYLLTIVKLRDFYESFFFFYFGMRNPTVRYFMLRSLLTCSGDGANWRKIQRLKAAKHANTALKQSRHWRGLRGLRGF